jgi:hypothetical protein
MPSSLPPWSLAVLGHDGVLVLILHAVEPVSQVDPLWGSSFRWGLAPGVLSTWW